MTIPTFPLTAAGRAPPNVDAYRLFDAHGHPVALGGIVFQMPGPSLPHGSEGNLYTVQNVAKMLNHAYELGREQAKEEMRNALGIKEDRG